MATERLTTRRLETIRSDSEAAYSIYDEQVPGLCIRVMPNGRKVWRFDYSAPRLDAVGNPVALSFDPEKRRKQLADDGQKVRVSRTITLGIYGDAPGLTLEAARRAATELHQKVRDGKDPMREREIEAAQKAEANRARAEALTLRQLLERRLGTTETPPGDDRLARSTREEYLAVVRRDVFSDALAAKPAAEVTADDIVKVLDRIEARGTTTGNKRAADMLLAVLSGTYKWAKVRRLVPGNPCSDIAKRGSVVPRTRVPSVSELVALLAALDSDAARMTPAMRQIVRIAMLTGQRRSEVAAARRSEVVLRGKASTALGHEVAAPVWIIPGDTQRRGRTEEGRTKNGREQIVPLSRQAAALFAEVLAGHDNAYLFPPIRQRGAQKHVNIDAASKAMQRVREQNGLADVTLHDLRRAISTTLGSMGFRADVIDHVLNHLPTSVTRKHYDFSHPTEDVRRAMQTWADTLDRAVAGESHSNVTVLRAVS